MKGHFAKAGVAAGRGVWEFRATEADLSGREVGGTIGVDVFTVGQAIDVTGQSKGKGFQGVMKRYNFQGGPAAHGSHFHRRPGSIGCRATPARVFANKKMPGHLGVETSTVQNVQVVEVNLEAGYMLLKGSIPGSKNGFVCVTKAVKK
jgi:large subunit ribosomal protein L3